MSNQDPAAILGLLFVASAIVYGLWIAAKETVEAIRWLRARRRSRRPTDDRRHLDQALERMGDNIAKRNARMAAHKRDPKEAPF